MTFTGPVVVVPFPFADSTKTKKRPAIVLSSEAFQKSNAHVTLAMITSAKHSHWHGDIEISDLDSAGLSASSIIRQKLFTIDERLIEKQVGRLSPSDRKRLQKIISAHLPILAAKS
jgi:mRNA interferase MazF